MPEKKYLYGASVIIVFVVVFMLNVGLTTIWLTSEGIMALQTAELRALYDLKVFVVCSQLLGKIGTDARTRTFLRVCIIEAYLRLSELRLGSHACSADKARRHRTRTAS